MKRENWGNQVSQVGKDALDGLTAGPFKHKILKEVENATIEWELVEVNSGSLKEPVLLSLDVSDSRYEAADGTKVEKTKMQSLYFVLVYFCDCKITVETAAESVG